MTLFNGSIVPHSKTGIAFRATGANTNFEMPIPRTVVDEFTQKTGAAPQIGQAILMTVEPRSGRSSVCGLIR